MALSACAAATPRTANLTGGSVAAIAAPVLHTLRVYDVRGAVTVQNGHQRVALLAQAVVPENQPVQVGPGSQLRLLLGQRALLEAGPNTRLVLHQLPRDGVGQERALWLRLEQGYLRVVNQDNASPRSIDISFGRWAAQIGAGEYFFEARRQSASLCTTTGTVRLSGVPEWTPRSLSEPCVMLAPHRSAVEVALRAQDWKTVRSLRRLEPTVARAAKQQTQRSVAQRQPQDLTTVKWSPPTTPGDFSPEKWVPIPSALPSLFSHVPPDTDGSPAADELADAPSPDAVSVTRFDLPSKEPQDPLMPGASASKTESSVAISLEAQSLLAAAPPAAGLPRGADQTVFVPRLKWDDSLDAHRSTLAVPPTRADDSTSSTAAPSARALSPGDETANPTSPPAEDPSVVIDANRAEWIVNVASHPTEEAAQQHVDELMAQGLAATVREETVRGRISYRVVIEDLASEAAAQKAVAHLNTRLGMRSAWAMQKR